MEALKQLKAALNKVLDRIRTFLDDVLDAIRTKQSKRLDALERIHHDAEGQETGDTMTKQSMIAQMYAEKKRGSQPYYKNVRGNAKPWE